MAVSDEIAIKVDGVSKVFKLPHEKQTSIKGAVIGAFRHGKRSYERQQVLDNVSFTIKKGEFFGIVGRNGSGKSTLLKLLAGIYVPNKGSVTVNGKLTPFIELGVGFNPELNGRDNVYLNGALLGFSRSEMDKLYPQIVEFAELERFMDQKLKNYSSGMQVRLAFSIAIQAKSDILLIDEVLAVGDEAFQRKCMDYFVRLKRDKQTVVFVTHDMAQVRRFCDRAIYVETGKIIADGNTAEIAELYTTKNLQLDGGSEEHAGDSEHRIRYKVEFPDGQRIKSGEDLRVRISWPEDQPVLNVGIGISKDTGEYVFGTNTVIDGMKITTNSVEYIVNCNLAPARYALAVATFKETDADLIDYSRNSAEFIVDPRPGATEWAGLTNLKHSWR